MTTGIYGIFDKRNGDCLYIGQSKSIKDRWRSHRKRLLGGRHLRDFTQWFQDQGCDISIMELRELEETDDTPAAKNEAEIRWFKELSPRFYGQVPSMSRVGWVQADETKRKISQSVRSRHAGHNYICSGCGSEFTQRRKKYNPKSYCSDDCYHESEGKANKLDVDKIYRLYFIEKKNVRYIANLMEVSDYTILKCMRENGMTPRPRGNKVACG